MVELHVPDFAPVIDFYSKLGFKEVWRTPPKDGERSGYLVIQRGQSIICFFCGNEEVYKQSYFRNFNRATPRGFGVELGIYIADQPIEKFYQNVSAALEPKHIVRKLEEKHWGGKDFRVVDPFGFYLCFRTPKNILEKQN